MHLAGQIMVEQDFGHLGATGIAGAKDQDVFHRAGSFKWEKFGVQAAQVWQL